MNNNYCKYEIIFTFDSDSTGSSDSSDSAASFLCFDILAFLDSEISSHLWNHQPFQLSPLSPGCDIATTKNTLRLVGRTDFGDCIADEWFIVHLLFKISRKYTNAIISIEDNDGQFILIEAAFHLPRWIDPEIIENRVWISNGLLHIIPPSLVPLNTRVTLETAINSIFSSNGKSVASLQIQKSVLETVKLALDEKHHANHVILPCDIARLLAMYPQLVSLISLLFLNPPLQSSSSRNSTDTSDNLTIELSSFDTTWQNCVCCILEFTKPTFAELKMKKAKMDRSILKVDELERICTYPSHFPLQYTWLDIGSKLTTGFRLMLSNPSIYEETYGHDGSLVLFSRFRGSPLPLDLHDLVSRFKASQLEIPNDKFEIMLDDREEKVKVEGNVIYECVHVDDDSWMLVSEEDVEKLVKDRVGTDAKKVSSPSDLESLVAQLSDFLHLDSGMKGASVFSGIGSYQQEETSGSDTNDDEDGLWEDAEEEEEEEEDEGEGIVDEEMVKVMEMMDNELFGTKARGDLSISGLKGKDGSKLEVIQNMLNSFAAQQGGSGPAQTLLNSFGVFLPPDNITSDEDSEEDQIGKKGK